MPNLRRAQRLMSARRRSHFGDRASGARHSRRLSPWPRHASVIHTLYLQRVLNSGTRRAISMAISNSCRLALTVSCSAFALAFAANAARAGDLINGNSLLVTTTTYEDVGQVAGL